MQSEPSKKDVVTFFLVMALVMGLGFMFGWICGEGAGTQDIHEQAIQAHAGRWRCDEHGKRRWEWCTQNSKD